MSKHHDYYLDQLIKHLDIIDEHPKDICWIMKDGLYYRRKSLQRLKLCDLIIGYYDNGVSCVELKGSRGGRRKATLQLASSEEFVNDHLGFEVTNQKIVYYTGGKYEWEEIE